MSSLYEFQRLEDKVHRLQTNLERVVSENKELEWRVRALEDALESGDHVRRLLRDDKWAGCAMIEGITNIVNGKGGWISPWRKKRIRRAFALRQWWSP